MAESFTPILTTTNWNDEWKAMQAFRKKADDSTYWDGRAATFTSKHGSHNYYVDRFIELSGIQPGETVFDMGCGAGSLALPLARMGCSVIACDFSQGMLAQLAADQEEQGVEGIERHLLSWSDDWWAAGIEPHCADVAIASRSIVTQDIGDSLERLTRVARRRACITLPCYSSPKIDPQLIEAAGLTNQMGRDFIYAFNILTARNLYPEVSYIDSVRYDTFGTVDEAVAYMYDVVEQAARGFVTEPELAEALRRVDEWVHANLIENERAGVPDKHGVPEGALRLKNARKTTWAFMAWNL